MDLAQLDGWIPIGIAWEQSGPVVDWCYLGSRRFTEPFFRDTVAACFQHPFAVVFRHRTPLAVLGERYACRPGLRPSGFIFHLSRCGSTLLAQMLAALPHNLVLSEPGPIDAVLRAGYRIPNLPEEQHLAWLRWIVSALGQPRGGEKHFFIKFDCWNVLQLPLVRRAFPEVPWIFLYRDPVEVLVSQLRQRGAYTVPGLLNPDPFGLQLPSGPPMPAEEYCSRLLGRMCAAALENYHRDPGLLLHYRQLPEAVWSTLGPAFGLPFSPEEIEQMRQVTKQDAKNPSLPFTEDTAEKAGLATASVRQAAEQWAGPFYQQLETARQCSTVSLGR